MAKARKGDERVDQQEPHPHRVRLPRFITDEEIGLGDAITRATSYFGIRPCGACGHRAAMLNRWVVFTTGGRDKRAI